MAPDSTDPAQPANGSPPAELFEQVYREIQTLARRHLVHSRWMSTLNTTSLINETYLKIAPAHMQAVTSRGHLLNLVSRVMRQVICDFARKQLRSRALFDASSPPVDGDRREAEELQEIRRMVALDDALRDLERSSPRLARIVECRFYSGLSEEETAVAVGASLRTVQRGWQQARDWLRNQLDGQADTSG